MRGSWVLAVLFCVVGRSAELPRFVPTPEEIARLHATVDAVPSRQGGRTFQMTLAPHWYANNDRFWYRKERTDGGWEFVSVECATGKRSPLFDHGKLADAATETVKGKFDPQRLPLTDIDVRDGGKAVRFRLNSVAWEFVTETGKLRKVESAEPNPKPKPEESEEEAAVEVDEFLGQLTSQPGPRPKSSNPRASEWRSPDGKSMLVIRDHNIVLKDSAGKETPVTRDGTAAKPFDGAFWSPTGKHAVGVRTEPGNFKSVYTIESSPRGGGPAKLHSQVYPLPGDSFPIRELWMLEIDSAKATRIAADPIEFRWSGIRWNKDGTRATYERTDRGHQRFRIVEIEAATAKTRTLYDDTSRTFVNQYANWAVHYLDESREILVTSERDGWNRLYRVDAANGRIRQAVTPTGMVFRRIVRVDPTARTVEFVACGAVAGEDPYHLHFYRVQWDGTGLTRLTDADGTHALTMSPDRRYAIDEYSRADQAPRFELRRMDTGAKVAEIDRADVSKWIEDGCRPPERFVAKGRDGTTDIYGLITRPRSFDPNKKYPVIEYIYAGPHDAHVPKAFRGWSGRQALADFGFIVVQCDGMGTGNRSKAFHDVCWRNVGDAGFPDRIAWIKAVAVRYPQLDIERVGIYGTSAGGQSSTGALLFHGDFYKVAVSSCGCHDNRMDKSSWNEQWMGYPVGPHYEAQSNITNAHRLRGKLLLIVGELDTNVPPESTYRLCDALIKAGKDFDFLMMPGVGHSDGGAYGERRRRDFFVRHLHGIGPIDWNSGKFDTKGPRK